MSSNFRSHTVQSPWLVGASICIVAIAGLVANARSVSIPTTASPSTTVAPSVVAPSGIPESTGAAAPASGLTPTQAESVRPQNGACSGCGIVASSGATASGYEVVVRMRERKTITFHEQTPRDWQRGDRVVVIPGRLAASS